MDFNFQERLKNLSEEDRRKMKVLSIAAIVVALLFFLVFNVFFPSEAEQEVSEIQVPNAKKVDDYNSKLEAISTADHDVSYQEDMNRYFEDKNLLPEDVLDFYSNEDQKVDSLMLVFEKENKTVQNKPNLKETASGSPSYHISKQNSSQNTQNHSNFETQQARVVNVNQEGTIKKVSKEEQSELNRQKRLNELKGNNMAMRNNSKSIGAVIRGNQNLKNGGTIIFNTTQDFNLNGVHIAKNTYINGKVNFIENKAQVKINSINVKGQILTCDIDVYALNGTKGIDIHVDEILNDTKSNVIRESTDKIGGIYGSASRLITDGIGRNARETKVTFIDNQKVLFIIN